MRALTGTSGIVALAGLAVALLALAGCAVLARQLHKLRAAQSAILDDQRPDDLIGHTAALQGEFSSLSAWVEDVAARLDERMDLAERRLDGAIAHHALVRYDAYGEMSGRQSMSIALLDANGSGVVLSAIHHRDQARLYAKQLEGGQAERELSPEEEHAVQLALTGDAHAEPRSS